MGRLGDIAKSNSKFLMIEKGKSAIVKLLDFKEVPDQRDPDRTQVQFKLQEENSSRPVYWTTGNTRVMFEFDRIDVGGWARIRRDKWVNQDGTEDETKSRYSVEPYNRGGIE